MISWPDIDCILLDMDGTLLDKHFDDYFWEELVPQKFAAKNDLPMDEAKKRLFAAYKAQERTLNWTDVDYWSGQLNLDIVAMKEEICDLVKVSPGAECFLQFLQRQGKTIVLVTNAHPKTMQIKLRRTPLIPYFTAMISSSEIGAPKEAIEFWREAEQRLKFDKGRTLFIDDNEAVLYTADRFGIKLLFHKNGDGGCKSHAGQKRFPSFSDFNDLYP